VIGRLALVAGLLISLAAAPARAQGEPMPPRARTVVRGAEFVTGIAFTTDGRMVFNERAGRVRIMQDGVVRDEPIATIETTTDGERGLLGIAVPPGDPAAYVFATAPDGATNRVVRVPLDLSRPEVVIESLPGNINHIGGGLAFLADGTLLVSQGDLGDSGRAQDPDALGGKIYRFTASGAVPPDNPYGDTPSFAIGLRNPYGITVDPVSGDAFVTENGPESNDEINRIVAGGNYGWPQVSGGAPASGFEGAGDYRPPLIAYPEIVVPTGIAVADPSSARRPYAGDLFFGTFGEGAVHRVVLDEDGAVESDEIFVDVGEPVVAVAWGPDGLYFSTEDEIRVVPIARGASPGPPAEAGEEGEGPIRNPVVFAIFTAVAVAVLALSRRKAARAARPR
jgi:glucose/arabinose dehydrogenase